MSESRPPFPPFTRETAIQKVRGAGDGWNSRDPHKVSLAYTVDSVWRNRAEFPVGREQIVAFLTRREPRARLSADQGTVALLIIASPFASPTSIAMTATSGGRSYGNENWEFGPDGLMHHRYACINDIRISESDRKFHWPLGRRPDDHPGLSDLGL